MRTLQFLQPKQNIRKFLENVAVSFCSKQMRIDYRMSIWPHWFCKIRSLPRFFRPHQARWPSITQTAQVQEKHYGWHRQSIQINISSNVRRIGSIFWWNMLLPPVSPELFELKLWTGVRNSRWYSCLTKEFLDAGVRRCLPSCTSLSSFQWSTPSSQLSTSTWTTITTIIITTITSKWGS